MKAKSRICKTCGSIFVPVNHKQVYCSHHCQTHKYNRACEKCGKQFSAARRTTRFCCRTCYREGYRRTPEERKKISEDHRRAWEASEKVCRQCSAPLVVGKNWYKSYEKIHFRLCKDCSGSHANAIRLKIIRMFGGKCVNCGQTDVRVLQVHHVKGGGKKERNRYNYNLYVYELILRRLLLGDHDYQILCANCNVEADLEKRTRSIVTRGSESHRELRKRIIMLLGGKCRRCGYVGDALQIDHVYDDGAVEFSKYRPGYEFYSHVSKEITEGSDRYQLLCANCNWIKRYENRA